MEILTTLYPRSPTKHWSWFSWNDDLLWFLFLACLLELFTFSFYSNRFSSLMMILYKNCTACCSVLGELLNSHLEAIFCYAFFLLLKLKGRKCLFSFWKFHFTRLTIVTIWLLEKTMKISLKGEESAFEWYTILCQITNKSFQNKKRETLRTYNSTIFKIIRYPWSIQNFILGPSVILQTLHFFIKKLTYSFISGSWINDPWSIHDSTMIESWMVLRELQLGSFLPGCATASY